MTDTSMSQPPEGRVRPGLATTPLSLVMVAAAWWGLAELVLVVYRLGPIVAGWIVEWLDASWVHLT